MDEARNMTNETPIAPKRRGIAVVLSIVFVFAVFAYFWRLGSFAVTDTDEATHAMVTRSILEDGNVLTLQLLGKDYFRKPPLAFWLRSGAMMVFGQTEFALRFFSALAGVGTAVLISLWAWQLTRRKSAALIAGLLFPMFPITHIHTFRHGDTDGVLIFLLTLAAYFLWRSLQRHSNLYWAAIALGLATMTKSAAMLVVPIAFAATLAVTRTWPYRTRHILIALALFLVIVAPWHAYEVVQHGSTFVQDYLGYHIVDRTVSPITASSHDRGLFWYLKAGEKGMYPWSWLVIPAAAFALTRFRKRREETQTQAFFLLWGFGTVLLYSLAVTKLDWYIAVAYPAFAILFGQCSAAFLSSPQPRWLRGLLLAVLAGLFVRSLQLFHAGVLTAFPFADAGWRMAILSTGALLVLLFVLAWVDAKRARQPLVPRLAAVAFVPLLLVSLQTWFGYARQASRESTFRVFRDAIETRDPSATVYIYDIGYYAKPETHWYLVGPYKRRQLIPFSEKEQKFREIALSDPGSFLVAEQNRVFPNDIRRRLERIEQHTTLVLYRIAAVP